MRLVLIHVTLSTFALSSCVSHPKHPAKGPLSDRERLLTGTWSASIGFDRWTVTRRPDRTFTENHTTDFPTAGTHFVSTGTWWIKNESYCHRHQQVNHPLFAQRLAGRKMCEHIVKLSSERFEYGRENEPAVVERKISPE
jgi:hypothetical protein